MFADRIDFIPKFKFKLFPEEKAILSKRVPLILNIKFNDQYNNNKANKPPSPHRFEKWEVDPTVIDFKIKNIRIHGGSGKLYRRINGSDVLGDPLKKGDKIRHGDTKLWYIPNSNKECYKHEISVDAVILTCDFDREAGEFVTCSVILDEPDYKINLTTEAEVAYIKNREGTPIELKITSDNPLAEFQKYKIFKSSITEGQGKLYIEGLDGIKKPICSNEPIQFGSNKLFYMPSLQEGNEEENHTIHLTVGNVQGYKTKDAKISLKVTDYKFEMILTTKEEVAYVKNREGTAICLTITSDNPSDDPEEYKILTSCIMGGKGDIMYEDLDGIKKPLCSNTIIKSGTHNLFYNPSLQKGSQEEIHKIHLAVGNVQGYKLQDLYLSIKVLDHKVSDYKVEMKIDTEDKLLLPYRESACTLTITALDKESKETEYKVHSISLGGGKFIMNGRELVEGTALKPGENKLIFRPLYHTGDIFPTIVITNTKGDVRYVKFSDQFVVSNPIFSVKTSIEDGHIVLHVSCDNKDKSDKFYITNYTVTGGIKGKLKTLRGKIVDKGIPVIVGDNKFTFDVDQTYLINIQEVPKIYFKVLFPDHSRINTDGLDLSKFVLSSLRPKIFDLENNSKELYKPLVQDYTDPLDPVMQQLINLESTWSNGGSKIQDILVFFQHGTDISDQATEALSNIQSLQTDTKDKMKKRILTTSLLSKWDKEINEIHAVQSSEERKIREDLLERQIESFSDVFASCVDIQGLQDIPLSLGMFRMRIETLKIETFRKGAVENQKETEYENFQKATRSAIEIESKNRKKLDERLENSIKQERETRQKAVERLENSIKEESKTRQKLDECLENSIKEERETRQKAVERLENIMQEEVDRLQSKISDLEISREEIEEKIKKHTGSIEGLEKQFNELDKVNRDLRKRLKYAYKAGNRMKELEREYQRLWGIGLSSKFKKTSEALNVERERATLQQDIQDLGINSDSD
ncbi:hypothetical protein ACRRVD_03155 [Candidatus Cardinium hertigii]|uniref:hypothetical protein n=1 Tax=Candidatus Cardinium hertigii TaxID=247481 RepID=UPI003D7DC4C1